jgi:two-component system, NtrC family, response regulator AtoC
VRELGARIGRGEPGLSRDAQELLQAYRWPGNIRELANAVERALILADGGLLTAAHFGLERPQEAAAPAPAAPPAPEALAALERRAILAALAHTKGNKTQAAALLGITRTQLHTRVKRFGLAA